MLPTIGRIIHVYEPLNDQCLAAIVTALDYDVRIAVPTVYCTVFPPHGARDDAAGRMILSEQGTWHDPRDCHQPPQANATAYPSALGTDTAGDETTAPSDRPDGGGERP